jgi:hypothetical protein
MQKALIARKQHMRNLDNKRLVVVTDVMPKDQYAKMRQHVNELQKRYDAASRG